MADSQADAGASGTMTAAQELLAEHARTGSHAATVEDTVDDEDLAHPRPPSTAVLHGPASPDAGSRPLSEKAAGKQKAQVPSDAPTRPGPKPAFNPDSEEMFPALAPPKQLSAQASPAAWGKKASAAGDGLHGPVNGIAGSGKPGSRSPTSASAGLPPAHSLTASQTSRQPAGSGIALPGRHTERIKFAPSQLLPRQQLKRHVHEILRDINKRSKAKIDMKAGPGGLVIFEGQGPVDAVRQALKEVANQVGSKQTTKVPIPASIRPHVIGRQGATIQGISRRTGARIQIAKPDELEDLADDDDDSATIDVIIEGDAVAAEMARREIEAIVNERTSTVNIKMKEIPYEYYPFLAGPQNASVTALEHGRDVRVQIPHQHTWIGRPPAPPASREQPATFTPQPTVPIIVSGERLAAQQVRNEIERRAEILKRQLTLEQLPIERGRHQFIVGDKGLSMHDFLSETGCTVILPPSAEDSEILTVVGPPERIEIGINRVMELASSMAMANVDISRQHANAPLGGHAHARNIARYLQHRRAIQQLESRHEASIIIPTSADGPVNWEVFSRDGKNTMRARADIMNVVSCYPPTRMRVVHMDPFFHDHLRQQGAADRIRDDLGVFVIPPPVGRASSDVLLVVEGPSSSSPSPSSSYELPQKPPSPAELREYERSLGEAEKHLQEILEKHGTVVSRELTAPQKFEDKVRKFLERERQSQNHSGIPVQLRFSDAKSHNTAAQPESPILVRGPSAEVDQLAESLAAFVIQEKKDELERGYTVSFDFPQKFANFLIGRKGENIKRIREEFDVEIQVADGKVELKGPKAKAEAARSYVLSLAKKLEDEVTHVLKIKPQFHGDLIGSKGAQVRRLQERYSVRINFPRAPNDDNGDEASETGASHRHSRNQAADEVIVKGPRRGADEAREELLNLLQWTIDNSHTATVSVAQSQLPSLIGQGGREVESLRLQSGAQIDLPGSRGSAESHDRVEIKLKGSKKQVEDAKKLLAERIRKFDNSTSRTVTVPKQHHKALIGANGTNIRNIIVASGGTAERQARIVRFPPPDSSSSAVTIEGDKEMVNKICKAIEDYAAKVQNQITETVEVAPSKHPKLIGRGGEVRRSIESQFSVSMDIPRRDTPGEAGSKIKLSGAPEDVERARAHILSLVTEAEAETIQVPVWCHHAISDKGHFFRRLRNDHKITIDHAGHQLPPRPNAGQTRARVNEGGLPLISDERKLDPVKNHSWELVDLTQDAVDKDATIPWVMKGSPDNVGQARALIEKAIQDAARQEAIGYLILPDPRLYRIIVGPTGSQVSSIRKKSHTQVQVPRDQARGEAIEIRGSRDGVEQARDLILDLLKHDTS